MDQQRLQQMIVGELDRCRSSVVAIDPRLAWFADLLVDFVATGGKRLRPEFLWCGWIAGGGDDSGVDNGGVPCADDTGLDHVLRVGAALELIQACALVHDDVIDRSEMRRGRPATHRAVALHHQQQELAGNSAHFGVSAAVLLGDLALAWADDLFVAGAAGLGAVEQALPVWRSMRTEVLSGQLLDLVATAAVDSDPAAQAADALRINRFKTAAYTVERPLHLGAALAGAGPETVAALRTYGADVGIAFQLRDDLLGVYGDPAVTGKPAGDDLLEGKRTLLLATARAALSGELLAELDAGIGAADADPVRLAEIITGTGAPASLELRISELVRSGLAAVDGIDPAARQRLVELAGKATTRQF